MCVCLSVRASTHVQVISYFSHVFFVLFFIMSKSMYIYMCVDMYCIKCVCVCVCVLR